MPTEAASVVHLIGGVKLAKHATLTAVWWPTPTRLELVPHLCLVTAIQVYIGILLQGLAGETVLTYPTQTDTVRTQPVLV